jgi:hypothetical protein
MQHVQLDFFVVPSYFVIYTDVWVRVHSVPSSLVRELWVEGVAVVLVQLMGGRGGREWGVLCPVGIVVCGAFPLLAWVRGLLFAWMSILFGAGAMPLLPLRSHFLARWGTPLVSPSLCLALCVLCVLYICSLGRCLHLLLPLRVVYVHV